MGEIANFSDAFYEERGKPDGSQGAVSIQHSTSEAFRDGSDSQLHYSSGCWDGGFTPSFVATLRTAREKIIAQNQTPDTHL